MTAGPDGLFPPCGHSQHALPSDTVCQLLTQPERAIVVSDSASLCPNTGDYFVFGWVRDAKTLTSLRWLNDGHYWKQKTKQFAYKDDCLLYVRKYYYGSSKNMCRIMYTLPADHYDYILIHYRRRAARNNDSGPSQQQNSVGNWQQTFSCCLHVCAR